MLLKDGELIDWELSRKAAISPESAATQAQIWIEQCKPDVVVTQKLTSACTKSIATKSKISAIAGVAANNTVLDVSVVRRQRHPNMYLEAEALTKRFPHFARHKPKKPTLWQDEPRATVYYEALALALEVIDRPLAD